MTLTLPAAKPAPSLLNIEETAEVVRILPLSDLHLPHNPEASRRITANQDYLRRMDMVVLLGDQCGSFGTEKEYGAVQNFIKQMNRPYTAINGNHEFYFVSPPEEQGRAGNFWAELDPEGKAEKLVRFCEFFGLESLWRAQHTHLGSFIFLGLNDVEKAKPETLTAAQWAFLETELAVAPDKPAFVFCHAPLMIEQRLDMVYYDEERTACVEAVGSARAALTERQAPVFWMSGHIHLRPDHYLFNAYLSGPNVWQVHCPDSWGYSRWQREQIVPQRHSELYSRHLEITRENVTLTVFDHWKRQEIAHQIVEF